MVAEPAEQKSATLTIAAPCRKCDRCLAYRAWKWSQRAQSELIQHQIAGHRSWLVTLTCRPDVHHRHLAEARLAHDLQDGFVVNQQTGEYEPIPTWEQLSPEQQWVRRCAPLQAEVTKYLKRVRKETGAQFRYLLVTEVHLGGGANHGEPHLHLLMHETSTDPLRERALRHQWPHGISEAKLVTTVEGGTYICKYLSKDARARVRASARYGSWEATPKTRPLDHSGSHVTNSPQNLHGAGSIPAPGRVVGGEPPTRDEVPPSATAVIQDFENAVREFWPDLDGGAVVVTASKGEKERDE